MSIRIVTFAGVLAAALLAQAAPAQTLYKSTTPDGRIIYSDKPPPDAIKTEKRQMDTSKKGVVPPSTGEKSTLKDLEGGRQSRQMSQDRVRKAEIALHDAETALEMGKEPQPGERIGTVSGASRLTDAYFERLKKLEEAVAAARANLERVRAAK
ncbi:MAG TPA: DUF4124 domain-containing protein [Burkholderiales bacterium]|nr:DUF4124 domain-containing protein [Burkholderiales bacterium]